MQESTPDFWAYRKVAILGIALLSLRPTSLVGQKFQQSSSASPQKDFVRFAYSSTVEWQVVAFLERLAITIASQVVLPTRQGFAGAAPGLTEMQRQQLREVSHLSRRVQSNTNSDSLALLFWVDSLRRITGIPDENLLARWMMQDPMEGDNGLPAMIPILRRLAGRPSLRSPLRRISSELHRASTRVLSRTVADECIAAADILAASLHLARGDTSHAIPLLLEVARLPYSSSARPAGTQLVAVASARHKQRLTLLALTLVRLETVAVDSASRVLDVALQHIYKTYVSTRKAAPDIIEGRVAPLSPPRPLSLNEYLDRQWTILYERGFPVLPSRITSRRVVVVEYATGMQCSSCNWHDHAYHALPRRYAPEVVVPLAYHMNYVLASPQDGGWDRWFSWYPIYAANPNFGFNYHGRTASQISQRTLITAEGDTLVNDFVDGRGLHEDPHRYELPVGQSLYERAVARIDEELQRPPEVRIRLATTVSGGHVRTRVTLDSLQGRHRNVALRLVLFEDTVWVHSGTTRRIYQNVVRGVTQSDSLTLGLPFHLAPDAIPQTVEYDFNIDSLQAAFLVWYDEAALMRVLSIPPSRAREMQTDFWRQHPDPHDIHIDRTRLHVAAFVQDLDTGDILQAAVVKVLDRFPGSRYTGSS